MSVSIRWYILQGCCQQQNIDGAWRKDAQFQLLFMASDYQCKKIRTMKNAFSLQSGSKIVILVKPKYNKTQYFVFWRICMHIIYCNNIHKAFTISSRLNPAAFRITTFLCFPRSFFVWMIVSGPRRSLLRRFHQATTTRRFASGSSKSTYLHSKQFFLSRVYNMKKEPVFTWKRSQQRSGLAVMCQSLPRFDKHMDLLNIQTLLATVTTWPWLMSTQ